MTDGQAALKARAAALFRPPADATKPDGMADYRAKRDAEQEKMARPAWARK
jgi:hypothetical protein